jgi:cytochrome c-type biogenesis protein
MSADLPYLTALFAGAISFLSPCVLPLVPPYLCYMAGVSLDTLTGKTDENDAALVSAARSRAIRHSLVFVLGFSLVFTALGAGASSIGQVMRAHMDTLAIIAGILIILMGLHFLGIFKINMLYREARFNTSKAGYIGSLLMGIAFAFGWTPCIGPVLGVILAMASSSQSIAEGATMLAVYSAGLGIPFILAALFIGPFMQFLNRFKKHLGTMEKVTGGLLVVTGLLFLTGGMQTASYWLLETFPSLGLLG